jgi:hypothetical protein
VTDERRVGREEQRLRDEGAEGGKSEAADLPVEGDQPEVEPGDD